MIIDQFLLKWGIQEVKSNLFRCIPGKKITLVNYSYNVTITLNIIINCFMKNQFNININTALNFKTCNSLKVKLSELRAFHSLEPFTQIHNAFLEVVLYLTLKLQSIISCVMIMAQAVINFCEIGQQICR